MKSKNYEYVPVIRQGDVYRTIADNYHFQRKNEVEDDLMIVPYNTKPDGRMSTSNAIEHLYLLINNKRIRVAVTKANDSNGVLLKSIQRRFPVWYQKIAEKKGNVKTYEWDFNLSDKKNSDDLLIDALHRQDMWVLTIIAKF